MFCLVLKLRNTGHLKHSFYPVYKHQLNNTSCELGVYLVLNLILGFVLQSWKKPLGAVCRLTELILIGYLEISVENPSVTAVTLGCGDLLTVFIPNSGSKGAELMVVPAVTEKYLFMLSFLVMLPPFFVNLVY